VLLLRGFVHPAAAMSLDQLPGTIKERTQITIDDISDDDDCDFAFLQKGAKKKEALADIERRKAQRASEPEAAPALAASPSAPGSSGSDAKRPRAPRVSPRRVSQRTRNKSPANVADSVILSDDDEEEEASAKLALEQEDAALLAKKGQQAAKLKQLQEAFSRADEEDEVEDLTDEKPSCAAPTATRPGASSKNVWLKVISDLTEEPAIFHIPRESPLAEFLVAKVAVRFGITAARLTLCRQGGPQLDLQRTPAALGLMDDELLEAAQSDQQMIKLKLQRGDTSTPTLLTYPIDSPLSELLSLYCTNNNLPIGSWRLRFDGDLLPLDQNARSFDLEDGDLLELIKAR